MLNVSTLRHRYTQFFVFFILSSIIYVMVKSIGPGTTNFQDNLYQKNFLIKRANLLRMKLGDRILPRALVGKDGWIDYTGDGNIDDFQNLKPFDHKRKAVSKLIALHGYLKSQDIDLLLVVIPNKATIYPDKLPEQIKSLPTESRLDQLLTALKARDLPIMVDLRPSLRAAREKQDVFFKDNNTHWNGYGAFVAYTAIMNALQRAHPELTPYQADDLEFVASNPRVWVPDFFYQPKKPFVQKLHPAGDYGYDQFSSIPDSKLPTLLMFHDSFGQYYLDDYLSWNFANSHFIHLLATPQYLNQGAIRQFNPDVVIIEIAERNLDQLFDFLDNFSY
jgi:alginate O-acetyltransferase complex protein AlgJ